MAITIEIPEGDIVVITRISDGYIGATSHYPKENGEDYHRGNDLADGPRNKETAMEIGEDIFAVADGFRNAFDRNQT